ncbi:MAG: ankyrin repeat domain-containing protein [Bacteroidales bacterium]|nr:ankyrin repeat domain-containing protein [Bacteroidales bacterium]
MEQGADINTLGRKGSTLLHVAAKGGSDLIVNDLIDRDLQVNVKDMFSMTPLHYAAKYGRLSVVKVLVENGAEINNRTRLEETPLNLAQKGGFKEVSDYLISKGAKQGLAEYTKVKGVYFGQREPGSKPEIFAPGIVTNINNGHSNVTFSPDGSKALWTEWNENESGYPDGCKILYSKIENGFWKIPEIVVKRGDVPIFSVDGTRVYFRATTQQASGQFIDEIQYFESNNIALGSAKTLQFDLTSSGLYWQFSFDKDENIYFASNNRLFKSQNEEGEYLPSEDLSKIYNPEYAEGSPFISKNGDYIIFSTRNTQGDIDLFIGYRKKDGSWTKPVNLGPEINTSKNEYLPIVTGDGKYLFFVSNREEGDFLRFWVSARIIDELRPRELK